MKRLLSTVGLFVATAMSQAQAPPVPAPAPALNLAPAPVLNSAPGYPGCATPAVAPACSPTCAPTVKTEPETTFDPMIWGDLGYLLWWVDDAASIPLVTTGDPRQFPPGAFGTPGTVVVYGGDGLDYGTFGGLRGNFGVWLDPAHTLGAEVGGFGLWRQGIGFAAGGDSTGNPPLYHPIYAVPPGANGAFILSDPRGFGFGALTGNVVIDSSLQLWGAETNGLLNFVKNANVRWDGLLGFRYLDLREDINFSRYLANTAVDVQQQQRESFRTSNNFYGGQFGTKLLFRAGAFSVDFVGKLGLGSSHQAVEISGFSATTGTGAPNGVTPGAVYTAPSNIGLYTRDRFAVVSQAQVKLGYAIVQNVQLYVGYDFLYWNEVVRAGNQVNGVINPTRFGDRPLAGPPLPQATFDTTDFWAQGVSFGFELRF